MDEWNAHGLLQKATGKGSVSHAWNLQKWVVAYMQHGTLPHNHYGHFNTSILDDGDLAQQSISTLQELLKKVIFGHRI